MCCWYVSHEGRVPCGWQHWGVARCHFEVPHTKRTLRDLKHVTVWSNQECWGRGGYKMHSWPGRGSCRILSSMPKYQSTKCHRHPSTKKPHPEALLQSVGKLAWGWPVLGLESHLSSDVFDIFTCAVLKSLWRWRLYQLLSVDARVGFVGDFR